MDIKAYQKATAILGSMKVEEDKKRDLDFIHDKVTNGGGIWVTSASGHTKIAIRGGLAIRIVELLQQGNNKEIESLQEQLAKL